MTRDRNQFDIIGDIHGHADTLRALLAKLGYVERGGVYSHPERRVIFVGDFIDRGPKIRETLRIARAMTDRGEALAVMGNHEYNAIRYHTAGPDGKPLRPHNEIDEGHKHYKNYKQHRATLDQLARPFPEEWAGWLAWFKSLPFSLDLGALRVVHASWSQESIGVVGDRRFSDDAFLLTASQPYHRDFKAVGALLNGPEIPLPEGRYYYDKEGMRHSKIRVRWFGTMRNGSAPTYKELIFPASDDAPEIEVSAEVLAGLRSYDEAEPPVVFGHYWMPPVALGCLARNAACVDYSVALPSGGLLAAYRWSGEEALSSGNLVAQARV